MLPSSVVWTVAKQNEETMISEFDCGWVEIARTHQHFGRLRAIKIFADGAQIGSINNGESKVFELKPGQHNVFAKIDWCKTAVHTLDIVAGETITLSLGSEIAGWKLMLTIIYLFMPGRMIYLKR
ncbi:hypothetical protein BH10CYA1_BH10CYA1_04290 [soil metagenome]